MSTNAVYATKSAEIDNIGATMIRDLDGHIVSWDEQAAKRYGFLSTDAVGSVSHTLLETQFPCSLEKINDQLLHANSWEGELIHTNSSGKRIKVRSRWELIKDELGKVINVRETNYGFIELKNRTAAIATAAALFMEYKFWWLMPIAIVLMVLGFIMSITSPRSESKIDLFDLETSQF